MASNDFSCAVNRWRLGVASFLLMFSQIALIRWIGSEVGVFAYLQNIILICCFLGFSLGLRAPEARDAEVEFCQSLAVLVGLVAVVGSLADWSFLATAVSALGRSYVSWNVFHGHEWSARFIPEVVLGMIVLFALVLLITLVFVPLGQIVARYFGRGPESLTSYLFNVAGSMVGVLLFYGCSYLSLGPVWWFSVIGVCGVGLFVSSQSCRGSTLLLAATPTLLILLSQSLSPETRVVWSPYQKLSLRWVSAPPNSMEGGYVRVNNAGYQIMLDLRPSTVLSKPELYTLGLERYAHYDRPSCQTCQRRDKKSRPIQSFEVFSKTVGVELPF